MKIRKARITGTGRRVTTFEGRQFIYDHLRKQAKEIPEMKDENGEIQNHYANIKQAYVFEGEKGVNRYLKECRNAIRRGNMQRKMILFAVKIGLIKVKREPVTEQTEIVKRIQP
jgi:hypothetical protein